MTTTRKTTTTRTTRSRKKDTVLEEPLAEETVGKVDIIPIEEPKVEEPAIIVEQPKVEKPVEKKPVRKKIEVKFGVVSERFIRSILLQVLEGLGVSLHIKNTFTLMKLVGKLLGLEPWEPGKGADHTRKYLERIVEKYNAG